MHGEPSPPRTSAFVRRFEVWFGGIFLGIGLAALLMAAVLGRVLGADPSMGSRIWAFLLAPLTVGIIFSTLGAIYLRRGVRRARREQRLLLAGTTAEAVVTAVEPTNTRVNRRVLWRVRYSYQDWSGGSHAGDSGYLSDDDAHRYRPGDTVFIRYDPERPSESMLIGHEELPERP